MDQEEALRIAAAAASGFKVLECAECAANIKRELSQGGFGGKLLRLRARGGRRFLVCLSYDEGRSAITQNGQHFAVRVGDTVFDNLHPQGMSFEQWLADFDAALGMDCEIVEEF